VRMEWRPAGWSVCLPPLISPCAIKSRSSLLAPAHLGGPGKRAVKGCGGGGKAMAFTTNRNRFQFCSIVNIHRQSRLYEMIASVVNTSRSFLINTTFSTESKRLASNEYCWSCKILVTEYRMHLRVNITCTKSVCLLKTNNRTLFLMLSSAMTPYCVYK